VADAAIRVTASVQGLRRDAWHGPSGFGGCRSGVDVDPRQEAPAGRFLLVEEAVVLSIISS